MFFSTDIVDRKKKKKPKPRPSKSGRVGHPEGQRHRKIQKQISRR